MAVDLGLQGYDSTKGENFYRQLSERVRALPVVDDVGWITVLPLELGGNSTDVYPADRATPKQAEMSSVIYNSSTPGYFAAMGIPLVAGRDFAETDGKKSPAVVIVNQALAENFWPGQDAVGKRVKTGNTGDTASAEVVGVAKNGKYQSIGEDRTMTIYYPMAQMYSPQAAMAVRTQMDAKAAIASVRGEVEKMDATLPVYNVKTLSEHMGFALFPLHAGAVAVGCFAVVAMILATIGIYGVMAYSVGQRTQEIGIRMALGARAGDVWRMVLRQGMVITGIGIVLGLGWGLCGVAGGRGVVVWSEFDGCDHVFGGVGLVDGRGDGGLFCAGAAGGEGGSGGGDSEFVRRRRGGSGFLTSFGVTSHY